MIATSFSDSGEPRPAAHASPWCGGIWISGAVFWATTRYSVLDMLLQGMTTTPRFVPFMTLA